MYDIEMQIRVKINFRNDKGPPVIAEIGKRVTRELAAAVAMVTEGRLGRPVVELKVGSYGEPMRVVDIAPEEVQEAEDPFAPIG